MKKATIKIYDSNGRMMGVIPLVSQLRFTKAINSGVGELVIDIPSKVNDFGEGFFIDFMHKIEVVVADKENPGGHVAYSGYIDTYELTESEGGQSVKIRVLGYQTLLNEVIHKSSTDVTIGYTSNTIESIVEDILTKYLAVHPNSPISTYANSDVVTGLGSLTDDFNSLTSLEALNRLIQKCPAGTYWYLDGDNKFHFKSKPNNATHTFVYGKDVIPPFKITKSITDLKNRVLFWDQDTSGSSNTKLYYRNDNTDKYWERYEKISDGRMSNAGASEDLAGAFIDNREVPNQQVQLRVQDSNSAKGGYNTDSIEVGDTFRINSLDTQSLFSDNIQITGITYTLDYVDIIGEDLRLLTSNKLTTLGRKVNELQFQDGQPNYTSVAV